MGNSKVIGSAGCPTCQLGPDSESRAMLRADGLIACIVCGRTSVPLPTSVGNAPHQIKLLIADLSSADRSDISVFTVTKVSNQRDEAYAAPDAAERLAGVAINGFGDDSVLDVNRVVLRAGDTPGAPAITLTYSPEDIKVADRLPSNIKIDDQNCPLSLRNRRDLPPSVSLAITKLVQAGYRVTNTDLAFSVLLFKGEGGLGVRAQVSY